MENGNNTRNGTLLHFASANKEVNRQKQSDDAPTQCRTELVITKRLQCKAAGCLTFFTKMCAFWALSLSLGSAPVPCWSLPKPDFDLHWG
mmetsp:Transcript_111174/g.192837  ORF Transcript_111174/g.192837 Transcript_111174/m.192837 type:complete len:90 (+) Transcript_111174:174-443(+)